MKQIISINLNEFSNEKTTKMTQITLHWPTSLAINPLDNCLYILDNHSVLKVLIILDNYIDIEQSIQNASIFFNFAFLTLDNTRKLGDSICW